MNRFSVKCPNCHFPLPAEQYNQPLTSPECPSCRVKVKAYALPALYLPVGNSTEAQEVQLGSAACFYHESKLAEHVCDSCGRFLCELCSLPMGHEMLCTSCLERKREEAEGSEHLIPRQTRYDKLALGLSIFPALIFLWPAMISAPITLFIAIRYWHPRGILVGGWRVRMGFAIFFALIEMVALFCLIYFGIYKFSRF